MSILTDGINVPTQTQRRRVREGTPVPAAAGFNPTDHTVAEVQAYLADNPDDTERVLATERAGKARATLIGD